MNMSPDWVLDSDGCKNKLYIYRGALRDIR